MHFDSLGLIPSTMITHAYLFDKDKKYVWTFASYEDNDELFSDRNVFPKGQKGLLYNKNGENK